MIAARTSKQNTTLEKCDKERDKHLAAFGKNKAWRKVGETWSLDHVTFCKHFLAAMAQGITRCAQWSRLTLEDMKRSQSKHAICCVRERKAKRRKGREQDFVMFATFRKLHRTKCLWKRKEVVVFKNYKNGQPFLSWLSASCFSLSFSSVPFSFGGVKS